MKNIPNVHGVCEDECLGGVKSDGNDITAVLQRQFISLFQGQISPKKLLVVGQLDDERNVECFL